MWFSKKHKTPTDVDPKVSCENIAKEGSKGVTSDVYKESDDVANNNDGRVNNVDVINNLNGNKEESQETGKSTSRDDSVDNNKDNDVEVSWDISIVVNDMDSVIEKDDDV